MKCLFCGYLEQKVLDSRPAREGEAIRRRRECLRCGRRFTTFEAPEHYRLYVVKRDGSREEFSKEKLFRGLTVACRKRPVSLEQLRKISDQIEQRLFEESAPEMSSSEVGRRALEALREVDNVSYVRFASVYMDFKSPEEFVDIVNSVVDRKSAEEAGV